MGVEYAIYAGYAPKGMVSFLDRLEGIRGKNNANTAILSKTHPTTQDRIAKINQLLSSMSDQSMYGALGTKRFQTFAGVLR